MMCIMVGKMDGVSILGNYQQQNMQVMYNLRQDRLRITRIDLAVLG